MSFFRWTGIDLGSHSIKIIQVVPSGQSFKLANVFLVPYSELVQEAGSEFPEDMGKILGERIEAGNIKVNSGLLGITSREGIIRYTRVPPVPPWRVKIIMEYEIAELASKAGSNITADYFTLPIPFRQPDEEMLNLVSLAKNDLLEERLTLLKAAGIDTKKVLPTCIGLYTSFQFLGEWEDDEVTLLYDIGHNNTDMAVQINGNLLFARSLSLGGNVFDEALIKSLGISPEKAESIKKKEGSLRNEGQSKVQEALKEGASRLFSVLNSSLGFCRSQLKRKDLEIDRILISGGTSRLPGLAEEMERSLEVPVEKFNPFEEMDLSSFKGEGLEQARNLAPHFASSLGLALNEKKEAHSLNLLPHEYKKQYEFKAKTLFLIGAGVFLAIYIVLSLLVAINLRSKGRERADKMQGQFEKARAFSRELGRLKEKNAENMKIIDHLQETTVTQFFSVKLLDFLNRNTPEGVYLKEFKLLPQEKKSSSWPYVIVCYADNSNLQAPQQIKKFSEGLDSLSFVTKTNISGDQDGRHKYERKYTIKIDCQPAD